VARVRLTSPLGFFAAANFGLDEVRKALPLKRGDAFDLAKYNDGVGEITRQIRLRFTDGFSGMRFVATVGELENCTSDSLEVNYVVFTAMLPPFSGRSFEHRQAELERPATTGGALGTTGRFLTIPDFGYDHTRHGYSGALIQTQVPLGIFDHIEAKSSASSNSFLAEFALSGKRTPATRFLGQSEWRLSGNYRDIPAGAQPLKEGMLAASFFGSTKALLQDELFFHYGASIAGGHQQGPTQDSPNSSYGDIKIVGGVEARWGSNAFTSSYGVQMGSTFTGNTLDFVKHVLDLRYSVVFNPLPKYLQKGQAHRQDDRPGLIGKDHKPLSLESRLNAGYIQVFGRVPGPERFFGGNSQQAPFIEGQPWDIRGQPYIRSIPENGLGSLASSFGVGGNRFYSFNLTVAKVVVGKALIPKDLGTADFVKSLDFGIDTAKGELSDTYFASDPAVKAATSEVSEIKKQIDELKLELPKFVFDAATTARIAPILKDLKSSVTVAGLTAQAILDKNKINETAIFMNTQIPLLEANLTKLQHALSAPEHSAVASQVGGMKDSLEMARMALKNNWTWTNTAAARSRADAHAEKDFSVAEKALNAFLYQLDAYSVAPVGILDIARVWPSGVGTRYAIGGGVRMSIINANFTLGYAANPRRAPGEGPGAFFFRIDVTDLFH